MAIGVGAGTSAVITSNAFSGKLRSISGLEETAEVFDVTDLSVDGNKHNLKAFAETIDHGPITIEYFYDPAIAIPVINTADTLTITFDTGLTLTGTGRIVARTGGQRVSNEISMGSFVWQFDGASDAITYDVTP